MISRRRLLTTGAASIVLIGGYASYKQMIVPVRQASAPWRDAGKGFEDPRLEALSYAILSPNPHNRQPWLVQMIDNDSLILRVDLNRLLPETDPYNRQIVVGLGAFLEALRQAAAELGYTLDVSLFPDGEPHPNLDHRPVASITFQETPNIEADPLFGAVLQRRTIRSPFDTKRSVTAATLQTLQDTAGLGDSQFQWTNEVQDVSSLKDICGRGWLAELNNPRTHLESTKLTRIGAAEVRENPDGISLSGLTIEAARVSGVLTRDAMKDPKSRAFSETKTFYLKAIDTAQAFGWINSPGNSRADQINAGVSWVRLHLAATQMGLAFQPLSQVLQEFPAMTDLYKEFHRFVSVAEPQRVQGLFRFGYASSPSPSPRWPLSSRLVEI